MTAFLPSLKTWVSCLILYEKHYGTGFDSLWADGYYCGSAGHVSQESVKRYIQEQEGKKVFDYDIFECPEELKGQLKIGDFFG